jgi:hypothetical protein
MMNEDVRLAAVELVLRELMTKLIMERRARQGLFDDVAKDAKLRAVQQMGSRLPRPEREIKAVRGAIDDLLKNIVTNPSDPEPPLSRDLR